MEKLILFFREDRIKNNLRFFSQREKKFTSLGIVAILFTFFLFIASESVFKISRFLLTLSSCVQFSRYML